MYVCVSGAGVENLMGGLDGGAGGLMGGLKGNLKRVIFDHSGQFWGHVRPLFKLFLAFDRFWVDFLPF